MQLQFPQALRLVLLAPEVIRAYQVEPERLRERIDAEAGAATVLIDEVQNAPQVLDVVHSQVEELPELRFMLTVSNACKCGRGYRLGGLHGLGAGQQLQLYRALQIDDCSRFLEAICFSQDNVLNLGREAEIPLKLAQNCVKMIEVPSGLPPAGVSAQGSAATGTAPEVLL